MKREDIRQKLLDGTIAVIARDGLDKATTKLIGTETGINEAYIYRHFQSKEDMFSKAFEQLDDELVEVTLRHMPVMNQEDLDYKQRCRAYFNPVWHFILGNKDKCLTYMRYYYSPLFGRFSQTEHKERYKTLTERFAMAFKEEANVWMLLNHALNVMLYFAVKVFDGSVGDNEDTEEHVFRLVYYSISPYFENAQEKELHE